MSFTAMTIICYISPPPGLGLEGPFVEVEGFEAGTSGDTASAPSSMHGGGEEVVKTMEIQV